MGMVIIALRGVVIIAETAEGSGDHRAHPDRVLPRRSPVVEGDPGTDW